MTLSGDAMRTRRSASSADALASVFVWPMTSNDSATCRPIFSTGLTAWTGSWNTIDACWARNSRSSRALIAVSSWPLDVTRPPSI